MNNKDGIDWEIVQPDASMVNESSTFTASDSGNSGYVYYTIGVTKLNGGIQYIATGQGFWMQNCRKQSVIYHQRTNENKRKRNFFQNRKIILR